MRNVKGSGWAIVAVSVMLLGGCGRSQSATSADNQAKPGERNAQGQSAEPQEVSLIGCIGAARGARDLVLQNVRFDRTSGAAAANEQVDRAISEGSWVRLTGIETGELTQHAGREVQVRGALADNTRATGTTGSEDRPTPGKSAEPASPQGDHSEAATDQHHANKVAKEAGPIARDFLPPGPGPDFRVREIKETGGSCPTTPQ
jgi:hypothetical protein